jgi:hypothetical protein
MWPASERILLRVHPGLLRRSVRNDGLAGGAQILANMIKVDQVAALRAELLLHLADDPGRAVSKRMNVGGRPEAGPHRTGEKLLSGGFDAALDAAGVDGRYAALGVREANLGLSPSERLALAFVLLAHVRLHDRDHPTIRFRDDLLVTPRGLRKRLGAQGGLGLRMHRLRMTQRDPLDRALADRKTIVLTQFKPHHSEWLIGGKIDDRPLQRP